MSFGKSNQPTKRHRPKKVVEVDEDEAREKREDKMNAPIIGTAISIAGSILMLGIVAMGAPYSYGSEQVRYDAREVKEAETLAKLGKKERADVDPKMLIDFTTIITTADIAQSETMKKVAQTCRQGRRSTLEAITPGKVHDALKKATKFLSCAMATERARFCHADERKLLVDQLIAYKETRQNAFAFEKYRDKALTKHAELQEFQRESGQEPFPPLKFSNNQSLDPEIDPGLLRQLENLVENGYISAKDFGYSGFYVPKEYRDSLAKGADRYAPC